MAHRDGASTHIHNTLARRGHPELPVSRQPDTVPSGYARRGVRSREFRGQALHSFLHNIMRVHLKSAELRTHPQRSLDASPPAYERNNRRKHNKHEGHLVRVRRLHKGGG